MTAEPIIVNVDGPSLPAEDVSAFLATQQAAALTAAEAITDALAEEADNFVIDFSGELLDQLRDLCNATGQSEAEVASSALGLYAEYVSTKRKGGQIIAEVDGAAEALSGLFPGDDE